MRYTFEDFVEIIAERLKLIDFEQEKYKYEIIEHEEYKLLNIKYEASKTIIIEPMKDLDK